MYATMIREAAARLGHVGANVRHVEGWMRSEHPTLDGLSRAQFREEVAVALECCREAGEEMSEAVARSHGL